MTSSLKPVRQGPARPACYLGMAMMRLGTRRGEGVHALSVVTVVTLVGDQPLREHPEPSPVPAPPGESPRPLARDNAWCGRRRGLGRSCSCVQCHSGWQRLCSSCPRQPAGLHLPSGPEENSLWGQPCHYLPRLNKHLSSPTLGRTCRHNPSLGIRLRALDWPESLALKEEGTG